MAIISIELFASRELKSSSGQAVEFDGMMSVSPRVSNTITRRPVEDGFDTNDAIHNNATIVDVTIIISDNAQSVLDTRAITNLANASGTKFLKSYTKKQLNKLQFISDNKETVTLKTKYNEYEDYFLEGFSYTETDIEGLTISFTLVENRTDEVETTRNFDDSIGLFS